MSEPEEYPSEFRVGSGADVEALERRPGELIAVFMPGTPEDRIDALVGGVGARDVPVGGESGVRPPRAGVRWLMTLGGAERDAARGLLAEPEVLLASPVYHVADEPTPSTACAPDPGVVIITPDDDCDVASIRQALGGAPFEMAFDADWSELVAPLMRFTLPRGPRTDDGFDLLSRIQELRGVKLAEFDWIKVDPLALVPGTARWNRQWNLHLMGMVKAWDRTLGDEAVPIAVIDTGFDLLHRDLQGRFVGKDRHGSFPALGMGGWNDGVQVDLAPTTVGPATNDWRWHGTAVAGLIGGALRSGSGLVGVAPRCPIMPIAVGLSDASIAAALAWARVKGARVVNFSITSATGHSSITHQVGQALGQKIVVCAATGNGIAGDRLDRVNYPARLDQVIGVGACGRDGSRKMIASEDGEGWFSRGGFGLNVMAPGVGIPTTDASGRGGYNRGGPGRSVEWFAKTYRGMAAGDHAGNYLHCFTGTSAAVAHVSGLAGLLVSQKPDRSADRVREIIEFTCERVGGPGLYPLPNKGAPWGPGMGCGVVDAGRALAYDTAP